METEGLAASALEFRSGGRRWQFEPSLCRRVVSLDKKLFTLFLFTQMYKWVPAIIMLCVCVGGGGV